MIRLWGIIRKNNKMRQNIVLELPGEALEDVLLEGVQALCEALDLPRPVLLSKHERELMQFHRTRFFPDDFMEPVQLDTFEVEQLLDKKKTR